MANPRCRTVRLQRAEDPKHHAGALQQRGVHPFMTTALDIRDHLYRNSPWVDPKETVDTVKAGDPARPVGKAGVCWYASIETVEAAHAAGCGLLICHEPVFWEHHDPEGYWRDKAPGAAKQAFLDETAIVILRAHDSWDQFPEVGIRDSWADFLGFTERVYGSEETEPHRYHGIYAVPEQSLAELAQYVADRVRPLGEDSVQVMGDPERQVCRPAVGVGCIGPDCDAVARGADVVIVCYDGASYWAVRERLHEQGAAVITVEHGTSEMPGLRNLRTYLAGVFPDIEFEYLAAHPRTWTVRGR
jgi:putative NIF3 family GTP cyclohydrolase 1 type 2